MADDIVYVMQDPPGDYTAAHQIEVGECVEFASPLRPEGALCPVLPQSPSSTRPEFIPV